MYHGCACAGTRGPRGCSVRTPAVMKCHRPNGEMPVSLCLLVFLSVRRCLLVLGMDTELPLDRPVEAVYRNQLASDVQPTEAFGWGVSAGGGAREAADRHCPLPHAGSFRIAAGHSPQ